VTRLLEPLEKQVFNRKDYNEFKEFVINSKRSFKGSEEAIQRTLEVMLTNVQWKERNYDQFTQAIKQLL